MSIRRCSSRRPRISRESFLCPRSCGEILGQHIQSIRQLDGRSLEEIAPLAGLTVEEWNRIEAGRAPDSWEQICLISAVLYIGRSWKPRLLRLWAVATGNLRR